MNALKDPTYRFPGNYGVEKFLELFSGTVHPHTFTYNLFIQLVDDIQQNAFMLDTRDHPWPRFGNK